MAKFTAEQAVSVAAINQLINDWGIELDIDNGRNIAALITEDVSYNVGGSIRTSRAEVVQFYADRQARLSATPAGVPIHRHALSNLRVAFNSADEAAITFTLVYFTTASVTTGTNHADPAAVADVRMKVRRGADGEWLIALFDSNQTFIRKPA